MSNDPIKELFKVGISRQDFIDNYKKMKEDQSNDSSIFSDSFSESIGVVFDFLNRPDADGKTDNILDESEISILTGLDKTDGDNVLSERDLIVMYNQMSEKAKEQNEDVQARFDREVTQKDGNFGENLDAYFIKLSGEYNEYDIKIEERRKQLESKLDEYENQISDLVEQSEVLDANEKKKYKEDAQALANYQREQRETESKIRQKEAELRNLEAEAARYKNYSEDVDEDSESDMNKDIEQQIAEVDKEYKDLVSKNNGYVENIAGLKRSMKSTQDKMIKNNDKYSARVMELRQKAEAEKAQADYQIQYYETLKASVVSQQDYAILQIMKNKATSSFSDEDTSGEWTTDAEELKAKWSKKGKHLSDEFYKKVVAIAGRMNCDPNALMGIMNAESGINPEAVNPNGGATGLIQFMPSTARGLGTSTSELLNMSPEEQLVYVEKFLTRAKQNAGFGDDEQLSAGQVYALVFLPARARREILTTSDELYYQANSASDTDGDGAITKRELDQRARRFMA